MYIFDVFFSELKILRRKDFPDNFQNKAGAGGQPLFGKNQIFVRICGYMLPLGHAECPSEKISLLNDILRVAIKILP